MKNKKITLRITESQFKTLCERIIEEETTKSNFIRNLIEEQGQICRKNNTSIRTFTNTKNKLLDIIKGKNDKNRFSRN